MTSGSAVRTRSTTRTARSPRRLRWIVLLIMALVTASVLAVYYTPLLGVRSVEVEGTTTLQQQDVVAASGIRIGEPMLQVGTADVARGLVQAVPRIATANVQRVWPSTIRIQVVERAAVAYVTSGTGVQLVDASGDAFMTVPQPPNVPELRVHAAPTDPARRAAIEVLATVTPAERAQVAAVEAPSPYDIRLLLKDGREVDWGDVSNGQYKAAILPVLLTRPGQVYDVRSPNLPTVAGG